MSNQILVGPLLGFEEGDFYTVCILLEPGSASPTLNVAGAQVPFKKVASVGQNEFWRAEFSMPAPAVGSVVAYSIDANGAALEDRHKRSGWSFYVPGITEEPLIAYASCNGFSSFELTRDTSYPYILWERMAAAHNGVPAQGGNPARAPQYFSLLLMGGDQVYADEIWKSTKLPTLKKWGELSEEKQHKAKVTATMAGEIEKFYDGLYIDRWANEHMSLMFASVPSVMMWDDHDIFDGWGSYPKERQECAVFQAIFQEAARVFDVFQLRCGTGNRLTPGARHRTLRLRFRHYQLLVLDNRSERNKDLIMSEQHWQDVKNWLKAFPPPGAPLPGGFSENLMVMTAVPAVYRSFANVEAILDTTLWHEELEDDVHDHWSSRPHLAERMRLIMVLLDFIKSQKDPVDGKCRYRGVLLSGDVHVGALGQVWNEREGVGLTQIISTGIVHPPPTAFEWAGIVVMTSDEPEALGDGDVVTEMLTPTGSPRYLRNRNYATLYAGTDGKMWVNWTCENQELKPSFAIE
jgi:hypothetical protein